MEESEVLVIGATTNALDARAVQGCLEGRITSIIIHDSAMPAQIGAALTALIANHRCRLQSLSITRSPSLQGNLMRRLCQAIISNKKTRLETLWLVDNNLRDADCTELAEVIRNNTSLKTINLNNNIFGYEGLVALHEAYRVNFYLTEMFLFGIPALQFADMDILNLITRNKKNNDINKIFADSLTQESGVRWGRSKLMVIGQGGAGKTSTVRALVNLPFVSQWESTIGADLKKTETSRWQEEDAGANFNDAAARVLLENRDRIGREFTGMMEEFEAKRDLSKQLKRAQRNNNGNNQVNHPGYVLNEEPEIEDDYGREELINAPEGGDNGFNELEIDQEVQIDPTLFANKNAKLMDDVDVARRFGNKLLGQAIANQGEEDPNKVTFTIWDYGGQEVFYTLHHLFLTKYGVYLIVFDLNALLPLGAEHPTDEAVAYLKFWTNSVLLHAPNAPVMLVGTHLDSINDHYIPKKNSNNWLTLNNKQKKGQQKVGEYLAKVNKILINQVKIRRNPELVENLVHGLSFFALDNSAGIGIKELRTSIEVSANQKAYVEQKIPLRWVLACDFLLDDEDAKSTWHSYDNVVKWGKQFGCPEKEVKMFLKLFNELGVLIYLSNTENLRDRVISEPQWVIDKIGLLIRDDMHGIPGELNEALHGEWLELRKQGLVTRLALEQIWGSKLSSGREKEAEVEFFVDLMQNAMLLSRWNYSGNTDEILYLVPSLLKETFQTNKQAQNEYRQLFENSDVVAFRMDFSQFFLPIGVFQRMICVLADILSSRKVHNVATPFLGKDFAFMEFPMNNESTSKIGLIVEGDNIKVYVQKKELAATFLKLMLSILGKLRAESMGSRLKLLVYLCNETIKADDNFEKLPWKEQTAAKKDESFGYWFSAENIGDNMLSSSVDLGNFLLE